MPLNHKSKIYFLMIAGREFKLLSERLLILLLLLLIFFKKLL